MTEQYLWLSEKDYDIFSSIKESWIICNELFNIWFNQDERLLHEAEEGLESFTSRLWAQYSTTEPPGGLQTTKQLHIFRSIKLYTHNNTAQSQLS